MLRWGVKHGHLPSGFAPYAAVEPIRLDCRPLLESDLPTEREFKALLEHADEGMGAMLRCYYHTGARTHELILARVGDFQPLSRTLVLGKHKRSKALKDPIPRTISLNADAYALLKSQCEGREPEAPLFPNRNGKAHTSTNLDHRFARIRHRAGVRAEITLYSFRHLWISEMLMAGVDVLLVARMAGTSLKMIETVYGHFRTQSFARALELLDAARGDQSI